MEKILAAIDVGTYKVCCLIGSLEAEGLKVIGQGVVPSRGLHKGLVVNIDEVRASVRDAVIRAEQMAGLRVEWAFVGITGAHVNSLNTKATVAISRSDRLVTPDALRRVLQLARNVPIPSDKTILHVIPRRYVLDDGIAVANPEGMYAEKLDAEVHLVMAAATSVRNLIRAIHGLGIEIRDLILEPLASAEAVLTEEEKEKGVILADIGGGTTDIVLFREGSIWHSSVLPVGGYQVTRDIFICMNIPFEIAEEMKKKYGDVSPRHEPPPPEEGAFVTNKTPAPSKEFYEILRARVEEILHLIMAEVSVYGDRREIAPAGLVLTGGTSNLRGIDELGREILGIPVRVGRPQNLTGLCEGLEDPAYATSVGLILWGVKHLGEEKWKGKELGRNLKGTLRRFFKALKQFFTGG